MIMENYIINTLLTLFFIGFIVCRYFYYYDDFTKPILRDL